MTPKPTDPTPPDAASLRALLDDHAAALDAATLSRLNRARQAALDDGFRPRVRRWQGWALAFPALTFSLLALWLMPTLTPPVADTGAELAELEALLEPVAVDGELLASDAPLELIDDWEFYAWLEQQPDVGRG